MSDRQPTEKIDKIASANWQLQPIQEVFPGIKPQYGKGKQKEKL